MQCPSCKKDLNFPETVLEQLTVCPFCKKNLVNREENQKDLLVNLIQTYGKDICSDERSDELKRLLHDAPEEYASQRDVLVLFSEYGLLSDIYDSISSSANDRKTEIKDTIGFLYRNFRIPVKKGLEMTLWISRGLEINVSSINEKSLNIVPLEFAIRETVKEIGMYKFGTRECVELVTESCERGIDVRNFIIQWRLGVLANLRNAIGGTCTERTAAFMSSVKLLTDVYIPESTAVKMVRTIADSIGFNTENDKYVDSRDGQVYRVVKIGDQIWIAENYRYKCKDSYAYCEQEKKVAKYGRLYTWNAAKVACPPGWHLPSRNEILKMQQFVCNDDFSDLVQEGDVESYFAPGKKTQEVLDFCLCPMNVGKSQNLFGFSAVSGGVRKYDGQCGEYEGIDGDYQWWTSTDSDKDPLGKTSRAYAFTFGDYISSNIPSPKQWAYPVRYLKNKK